MKDLFYLGLNVSEAAREFERIADEVRCAMAVVKSFGCKNAADEMAYVANAWDQRAKIFLKLVCAEVEKQTTPIADMGQETD